MKLELFDANVFIGRENSKRTFKPALSGESLLSFMDEVNIDKALVWHIAQYDYSVPEGNKLLSNMIRGMDRLYGCWSLLPPQTGELPEEESFFKHMKQQRIYALRAFPGMDQNYLLNRTTFGGFLDSIAERRIPLLYSIRDTTSDYNTIYTVLGQYPGLTCILCDTGGWGQDRYFRPLIEKYKNVFIETSFLSCQDGVMEDFVEKYGPERLLFGSGFPKREPLSAILSLLHCGITQKDKEYIAYINLERLMDGAVL